MSKVILPHPEKGSLGKYSTSSAERTRHTDLNKSVREHGYKSTVLDLNLRATLNKNQAPAASKVMREDMDYLRQKYRGGKSKGSRKSRQRKSRKSARPVRASRKSRKSRQHRSRKSVRQMHNHQRGSRKSKK